MAYAPIFKIGADIAELQFAGLVGPGKFQFNVVVPAITPDGDQTILATSNGTATRTGTLLTVQHGPANFWAGYNLSPTVLNILSFRS